MKKIIIKNSFKLLIAASLLCTATFNSCKDFLEIDSRHLINEENQWKSINDVRGALLGTYGLLKTAMTENNAHLLYGELRGGDFVSDSRRDLSAIINNELKSSYSVVKTASNWRRFYATINAANVFIERSKEVTVLDPQYTEEINNIDVAQMRAIKGFCYFILARTWGDVPIWNKAYEGVFPEIGQSSAAQVLAYAENELKAAAALLPFLYGSLSDEIYASNTYHGYSFDRWQGVLLNQLSVNAVLAHLTAWQGNYFETNIYSNFVINNMDKGFAAFTDASQLTSVPGLFSAPSGSHLVAFQSKNEYAEVSATDHIESMTLANPIVQKPVQDIYVPVERIVQIFSEPNDVRFNFDPQTSLIRTSYFNFSSYRPMFSKIQVISSNNADENTSVSTGTIQFSLFSSTLIFSRIEDIALLRAEALAMTGNESDALGIVNTLRKRRGFPGELELTDVNVIDEIFKERNKELLGEGWRWFDWIRYKKIKGNDAAFNAFMADKGVYWPVADDVLINNSKLVQNPYWQ